MIYDTAVIGAGAAGLFTGSCLAGRNAGKTILLEKGKQPGRKLLMAGSGQCNLTHGGSIRDFLGHYGPAGKKIRSVLYPFNNNEVISYFEERGCPLFTREDGKVFPQSLQGLDILNTLVQSCEKGGMEFRFSSPVEALEKEETGEGFRISCGTSHSSEPLRARRVIVATGGCSYPTTGSDGSFFSVLAGLGLELVTPRPALVPVHVENYPYTGLSGISFSPAALTLSDGKDGKKIGLNNDDLLLTHRSFSGPAVLNLSRLARPGQKLTVNYLPGQNRSETERRLKAAASGDGRQTLTLLCGCFPTLPRRFLETLCHRAGAMPQSKAASLSGGVLKTLSALLTEDSYTVSGTDGFSSAMVTAGGVSLDQVNLKTMECKEYPGLYIIGEALDIDGDTGGYNLQFAFSSAHLAAISSTTNLQPGKVPQ